MMAALLKDTKQRAAAKKMLGSMDKGGVMNATGETGSKRSTRSSATKSDKKGKTVEGQAMAIMKQRGAERQAVLQPFYNLESEVKAARKKYDEHLERLKALNKYGRPYDRMLQTLRKDREAIASLLKDDRMNIEGVSGVEKSNLRRMMPK